MKKIVVTAVCLAIILSLGIILWNHNQRNVNEVVDVLNEATSHYGDMNTSNDKTFSLRVDDMQILLITHAPSYSLQMCIRDRLLVRRYIYAGWR